MHVHGIQNEKALYDQINTVTVCGIFTLKAKSPFVGHTMK